MGMHNDRLVLIPARNGSTRVKNKNLRLLAGKPLVAHVVESAVGAGCARVIVSTNSMEIAQVAIAHGAEAPFLRPPELATAMSSSLSVILHALLWLREHEGWKPEYIAFCPPTNPGLTAGTIRRMFDLLHVRPAANSIVTITRPRTHPFRIVRRFADGKIETGVIVIDGKTVNDIERTQDWPEVWEGSPACRMSRTRYFWGLLGQTADPYAIEGKTYDSKNCLGYEISSREGADIDDEDDFIMVEAWFRQVSGMLKENSYNAQLSMPEL